MKKKMKKTAKLLFKLAVFVLLPVALLIAYGASAKSEWTTLKPGTFKDTIKIKSVNKERTYYSLYGDAPVVLKVKGPVFLRVITRFDFDTAIANSEPYEIRVFIDDSKEFKSFINKSEPSYLSTFTDLPEKTPGKIRNIELEIPEGSHTLTFVYNTNKVDRVVRLRFQCKKGTKADEEKEKGKWRFLKPIKYKDEVPMYVENKKRDYFRFSSDTPLEIKTQGPAMLKVLTRLEFSANVTGNEYEVRILEDGLLKNEQVFQTKKALRVAYAADTDLAAGMKKELIVEIPDGEHIYTVEVKNPRSATVLCRPMVKINKN